ncbi:AAA family ATPase [Roseibium aggregatum]|uniref:AAA family ATPase n=1 Tax=Roseibium aggregatum TaxID=187304 RepID=UPI001A8D9EA1|nr:ATP-binding protein [Roseibium aggregatum]MBN8183118.1 AAA family ATPase [Roseibium aggregatum]
MERINLDDLFDRRLTFPDMSASRRLSRMVGVDEPKSRLSKILGILINPDGPRKWAERHHRGANTLLEYVERRPPLVVLAGDVGTGKTELAENIGDAVARQEDLEVTLYPISLAARGSGRVGEMTQLVAAAFDHVLEAAKKLKRSSGKAAGGIILLVDEADALTQSREEGQMHHEDRAGVNAFIRGVDRLAEQHVPVAVILCTNRLSAIDPAVQRRAAEVFSFGRPNDIQRRAVVEGPLTEAGFSSSQIDKMVAITGPRSKDGIGFTFSDLTQRVLPTLVLDAYPDRAITFERAIQIVQNLTPTPQFLDVQKANR